MKIVETFPFFNELDLLEVHLATMDPVVDLFVITEARQSHSGLEKPLYLSENLHLFERFQEKIIVQVVDSFPESIRLFEADWYQREQAKKILEDIMSDGDYLIYGDVDEIPRVSAVRRSIGILEDETSLDVAHLAQDLFYYYLNLKEVSGRLLSFMGEYPGIKEKKWLGTTVNRWSRIHDWKLTDLRRPERKISGVRVPYGGWHFSWVGGPTKESTASRVETKLRNTAHQEFKTSRNLKLLQKRVSHGKDLVNRRGAKFTRISDLGFLPDYILENFDRFQHMILK